MFSVGQIYGRLTVIELIPNSPKVTCKCSCGTIKDCNKGDLRRGNTKSCGCLNKELLSKRRTMKADYPKLYGVYKTMINRCYRPNSRSYEIYGERGIRVCNEWLESFNTFCTWCLENGYKVGLTLDRINVNGNYEPQNCRFVDRKTQVRNRRCTVKITILGETKPVAEWAEILNVDPKRLYCRIKTGTVENFILKLKGNSYERNERNSIS